MPFPDRRRSPGRRGDSREPDRFERRRLRSVSPDRYRRSSPPHKRYRREDDFYDRHRSPSPFGRSGRRDSGGYGERGGRGYEEHPPYHEEYEEQGGKGEGHHHQPMSFKEFLYDLPMDDISPEEAKQKYETYLTEWYGSERRAEFERHKNEDWMKDRHDPRRIEEALKRRNENAKISAETFEEDITQGKIDPMSHDFGQGEIQIEESKDDKQGEKDKKENSVPQICWKEEIIDEDFKLSRELIMKLDGQKNIQSNPLKISPKKEDQSGAKKGGEEKSEGGDVKSGYDSDDKMKDQEGDDAEEEEEEEDDVVEEDTGLFPQATRVQKLDLQLAYLWMVHGVDYYAGYELKLDEYKVRMNRQRLLRPPQLEDVKEDQEEISEKPQQQGEGTSDKALEEYKEKVQKFWKERMDTMDPAEKPLQKGRVEKEIEDWIESQIIRLNDQKWGSRLSQKLFIEKRYVVKHIKTKQTDAVDQKKTEVLDEIYFENYRQDCEQQDRMERERQQASQRAHSDAQQGGGVNSTSMEMNDPGRMMMEAEEEAYRRGMPMRGEMMYGRGMPRRGGRGPPIMQMGPPAAFMGPPGPYGPIVFAPPPMMATPQVRGGRGGRSRTRPAMPFVMTAPPGTKLDARGYRDYFDLDAPQNNRAVLDYGDL